MAQNKVYEELVYQIVALLKQGELYPRYVRSIEEGKGDYKISQVYTKKNYSTEWIDTIEDCIVALDTIVRNPRKFIVIEEDIVDISLARSISVESVKHLSQHTNLISSVTKDGMVIPSKILNTSKEESFEIYENRFIYTLLLKLRDFIEIRTNAIKSALMQSGELGVEVESEFAVDKNKVSYSMRSNANFPFDPYVKRSGGGASDMERVSRIKMIISDFLGSPFGKEMRSCALVRPPIQRTNVILKDPNFKKALVLWQYIETSEKMDFKIETTTETVEMNPAIADKFKSIIYLNTILMQSIASTHEASESLESKKEKEKIVADEYVTRNIDDFVPDDFPSLKLDINQIRTIYKKIPTEKTLSSAQIKKINGALDRVIRQYKINEAKEESKLRLKLVAEQLEEERQAKLLALREKADLSRRLRADRARKRLEARRAEAERAEAEARLKREEEENRRKTELIEMRKAELKRELERMKSEGEAKQAAYEKELTEKYADAIAAYEEARRRNEQEKARLAAAEKSLENAKTEFDASVEALKKKFEEEEKARRKQIELAARAEVEKKTLDEDRESKARLAEQAELASERIRQEKEEEISRLKAENDRFWTNEHVTLVSLGLNKKLVTISENERKQIAKILKKEEEEKNYFRSIEQKFKLKNAANELENLKVISEIAVKFIGDDNVDRLIEKRINEIRKLQRERKKNRRKNEKKKR